MPRELVAIAPHKPVIREYQEPKLQPKQVRIRTEFSSPKHGTELGKYKGDSPLNQMKYDRELGVFLPREKGFSPFPSPLGNMSVGVITEVGSGVNRFKVGQRVFGHLPIRETHTVDEGKVNPVPDKMTPEQVVYWDPAIFALGAVRDANVRLGERVAIFGMGAIGLMALQMSQLSGAMCVYAVDPLEKRRKAAKKYGAYMAVNPAEEDAGLKVKKDAGKGVDVAIEASGSYQALHSAIRCVHLGGLVVPLAFYKGEAKGLRLGEEWHFNRITMRSSRTASDPNRDHPMWDSKRIKETAFYLLKEGKLSVDGLIDPVVPFTESAEAYQRISKFPGESIKLGIIYPKIGKY